MPQRLDYKAICQKYPFVNNNDIRKKVARLLGSGTIKIVVLDDDPTGIQTVHSCLVLTDWSEDTLRMAFEDDIPFFYVLTNSRSMNEARAEKINREVAGAVLKTNEGYGYKIIFISRSDSTLRGHFPLETNTIQNVLGRYNLKTGLPVVFTPAFFEAGRYTINNVHYYKDGDLLVPVSESEFAHDNVFGYKNSNLVDYIGEKTGNSVKPEEILVLTIDELRNYSTEKIIAKIELNKTVRYVISNAWQYTDLYMLAMAVLTIALKQNKNPLVLRTSSSFPKAISGIDDKPVLTGKELQTSGGKGIFIVGSHVKKTTHQLNKLLEEESVQGVEIPVTLVINSPDSLLGEIISQIKSIWHSNKTPVLFTSRQEVRSDSKNERLNFGKKISEFLVNIVLHLPSKPAYLISKGGITSYDILTKGLKLQSARVAGQVLPGVPVVVTGPDHGWKNMPYIIFPGNVGGEDAMARVLGILS